MAQAKSKPHVYKVADRCKNMIAAAEELQKLADKVSVASGSDLDVIQLELHHILHGLKMHEARQLRFSGIAVEGMDDSRLRMIAALFGNQTKANCQKSAGRVKIAERTVDLTRLAKDLPPFVRSGCLHLLTKEHVDFERGCPTLELCTFRELIWICAACHHKDKKAALPEDFGDFIDAKIESVRPRQGESIIDGPSSEGIGTLGASLLEAFPGNAELSLLEEKDFWQKAAEMTPFLHVANLAELFDVAWGFETEITGMFRELSGALGRLRNERVFAIENIKDNGNLQIADKQKHSHELDAGLLVLLAKRFQLQLLADCKPPLSETEITLFPCKFDLLDKNISPHRRAFLDGKQAMLTSLMLNSSKFDVALTCYGRVSSDSKSNLANKDRTPGGAAIFNIFIPASGNLSELSGLFENVYGLGEVGTGAQKLGMETATGAGGTHKQQSFKEQIFSLIDFREIDSRAQDDLDRIRQDLKAVFVRLNGLDYGEDVVSLDHIRSLLQAAFKNNRFALMLKSIVFDAYAFEMHLHALWQNGGMTTGPNLDLASARIAEIALEWWEKKLKSETALVHWVSAPRAEEKLLTLLALALVACAKENGLPDMIAMSVKPTLSVIRFSIEHINQLARIVAQLVNAFVATPGISEGRQCRPTSRLDMPESDWPRKNFEEWMNALLSHCFSKGTAIDVQAVKIELEEIGNKIRLAI